MLLLHYDLSSPSSAVAVLRLQRIADEGGEVRFSGLDPLGLEIPVPATLDQLEEFERWRDEARGLGLDMRRPRWRPPTARAHVIGDLADEVGRGASWRTTCLQAYWSEQADLADADVLVPLAARAGLPTDEATRRLVDPTRIGAVRDRLVASHQRGIGGVPVLEVDGTLVSPHLDETSLRHLAGV